MQTWVGEKPSIGQEVSQPRLRPSVHDKTSNPMQIGTRIHIVSNTRCYDREDMPCPLPTFIEPREEPILPAQDQPMQFPFASIVGGLDIPIFEKTQKALPLSMQISECPSERCFRRGRSSMTIDSRSDLVEDRTGVGLTSCLSLVDTVARNGRFTLDGEQPRDDSQSLDCDGVTSPCGIHETPPSMTPAARALAARAFQKRRHACSVALHRAREVVAKETFDAVGISTWRIEEAYPPRVGPAPHRSATNALRSAGIENRNAGGIGAKQPRPPYLLVDEFGHRRQQVDRRGNAATERLRSDVDTSPCKARALSLDRKMLNVFIAQCFDDERIDKVAALDDLRWHRG